MEGTGSNKNLTLSLFFLAFNLFPFQFFLQSYSIFFLLNLDNNKNLYKVDNQFKELNKMAYNIPGAVEHLQRFSQLVDESFARCDPGNCFLLPSRGLSILLSEKNSFLTVCGLQTQIDRRLK